MSKLSKKEIERVASLARIKFSEKEKEKMADGLSAVLSYIDKLKEVDTEGIEPISNMTGMENVLRKDEAIKKPLEDQAADAVKLVEMAPDSKDNFVKVKAIFGE